MSLFRSILPGRALQRHNDYDLPLYRDQPEIQSFPPAPIANSIFMAQPRSEAPKPSSPASTKPRSHDLAYLLRKERYYQQKLQDLIDAQSDGLEEGRDGSSEPEQSIDTPTQTTYSLRSGSVSPAPHERRRPKRTLAQARRGIWKTILDCAAVKGEEDGLLRQELREDQAILKQLESWSSREIGLQQKIAAIEKEDNNATVETMKQEASKLEQDIHEMETRLAQMKTRHRQLLHQISDVEDSVRSKISSYKTSLTMLEKDVQDFLASPPVKDDQLEGDSLFMSLPPDRRTLQLAKEHWQSDVEHLKKERRSIRKHRMALEDGAMIWQDVVAEITKYERYLREEMGKLTQQSSAHKGKAKVTAASPDELLDHLDEVTRAVEKKLELAQKNNWRLLEVCIAAEFQALQDGKVLLENIFNVMHAEKHESLAEDVQTEESTNEAEAPSTQDSSTRDLYASAAEGLGSGPTSNSVALRKSMYEDDDGPDPDLLFSRPTEDTD